MRDVVLPPTFAAFPPPGHWDFALAGHATEISRRLDCRDPLHLPDVKVPPDRDLLPVPPPQKDQQGPIPLPIRRPTSTTLDSHGGTDSFHAPDGMLCKVGPYLPGVGYLPFHSEWEREKKPEDHFKRRPNWDVYPESLPGRAPAIAPIPEPPRYNADFSVAPGFIGLSALHVVAQRLAETYGVIYSVEQTGGSWLIPVVKITVRGNSEADVKKFCQALKALYAGEVVA